MIQSFKSSLEQESWLFNRVSRPDLQNTVIDHSSIRTIELVNVFHALQHPSFVHWCRSLIKKTIYRQTQQLYPQTQRLTQVNKCTGSDSSTPLFHWVLEPWRQSGIQGKMLPGIYFINPFQLKIRKFYFSQSSRGSQICFLKRVS